MSPVDIAQNAVLRELFAADTYRFQMRFQRGAFETFFGPTTEHAKIVEQRKKWLEVGPHLYAALRPEGEPLLAETVALARQFQTCPNLAAAVPASEAAGPWELCLGLGRSWEPDFLLLARGFDGRFRLGGGAVCFPSSWSLPEKMGHSVDVIHSVVPGLNEVLGRQIEGFLAKIVPGQAWLRSNWGLSRSPELNQHPARQLPRLDASVGLADIWLRVENQALVALPVTRGILFGIRIVLYPLAQVSSDPWLRGGLARALATMPDAMARYKHLDAARPGLLRMLA